MARIERNHMRRVVLGLAAWIACAVWSSAQAATADPTAGRATATASCSGCHLVGDDAGQRVVEGVPTFRAIARDPAMTESRLRGFLNKPHPPMPEISLTRREIDNLVSYIQSLKDDARR